MKLSVKTRKAIRLLLGCLFGILGASSYLGAAGLQLEVISLRYRTAEQVLPLIQPLVPKPGTVSGMQTSLVVRTTPDNLAELRRVLDAIDRPPRRLVITVRHNADRSRIDSEPGRDRVYGTQSLENDRTAQQIQVLEGSEAYIGVGQSLPVPSRTVVRGRIGGRVVEHTVDQVDYRDTLTGFNVRPRLAGDIVTLDVSPQRDKPIANVPGGVDIQRAVTTVSGRLGEWIELGAVVTGRSLEEAGSGYRTRSVSGDDRRILLKVDEIP